MSIRNLYSASSQNATNALYALVSREKKSLLAACEAGGTACWGHLAASSRPSGWQWKKLDCRMLSAHDAVRPADDDWLIANVVEWQSWRPVYSGQSDRRRIVSEARGGIASPNIFFACEF